MFIKRFLLGKSKALLSLLCLTISFVSSADPKVVLKPEYYSGLLDRQTITDIFTRKKTHWRDGTAIRVYIKPIDSIENREFVMDVLFMTLYRFKTSLEEQTYSGRATGLIEVFDDNTMIAKIIQTPSAIGYVNNKVIVNGKEIKIIDSSSL
jgi:ABC-type phosphate transport system substrate-binding protein